ncbi:hypothetical protein EIN_403500 [Entamoeba invadens IP1]|uniref:Uncharacterized protein n=1 Tax=Entamoeba invadens IP1 TaxID=370355 RepID=A0A0A1UA36_ENTIV|nr:hypothetical protein EIN_403500 [Entamoeba invadens IP1]ELP90016.1 hypothetical protein EIN_403500 [Entamoeba invadens IP1]|eukprot:XP_004256787.1 hypothetical protein EIN_403500 [Entamoeba invadens IP1]
MDRIGGTLFTKLFSIFYGNTSTKPDQNLRVVFFNDMGSDDYVPAKGEFIIRLPLSEIDGNFEDTGTQTVISSQTINPPSVSVTSSQLQTTSLQHENSFSLVTPPFRPPEVVRPVTTPPLQECPIDDSYQYFIDCSFQTQFRVWCYPFDSGPVIEVCLDKGVYYMDYNNNLRSIVGNNLVLIFNGCVYTYNDNTHTLSFYLKMI